MYFKFNTVARNVPGGKHILIIKINAQHNALSKAIKTRSKIEIIYCDVSSKLKTSSDKWIILHTKFEYISMLMVLLYLQGVKLQGVIKDIDV